MEVSDGKMLAEWFWKDTIAGKMLQAVRGVCLKSGDQALQRAAIVPRGFEPTLPPGAGQ